MTGLATTLQAFFTDRLVRQRQVSANTIQAYRDTLRLLLVFASERQGKSPVRLDIDDLDAPLIGAFLGHLEHERQNGVRTRNARLAAIRSLFRYAALTEGVTTTPTHRDNVNFAADEYKYFSGDSDDDGMPDWYEVAIGLNPGSNEASMVGT